MSARTFACQRNNRSVVTSANSITKPNQPSNRPITVVESSSSPVGPPQGVGYLYRGGAIRFYNNSDFKIDVTQSGPNVGVRINAINVPPSAIPPPQITSVIGPNLDDEYIINGTGQPGATITVGTESVLVTSGGTFTITVPLSAGENVVNQSGGLSASIFLAGSIGSVPILVTGVVNNGDGTYDVSGTGQPGATITIGNQTILIPSTGPDAGQFTFDNVTLIEGVNDITNSNGDVIGSLFIEATIEEALYATVSTIETNPITGAYTVSGIATPGLTITLDGVDTATDPQSGEFTFDSVTLNDGPNQITTLINSIPTVIGTIFSQDGQLIQPVQVDSLVFDANSGTYTISGSGPNGDYSINTTPPQSLTIDNGLFEVSGITLDVGTTTIINSSNVTVGTIYVSEVTSYFAEVGTLTLNSDGVSYTIEGQTNVPDGSTITIGTTSMTTYSGTFDSTNLVGLSEGANSIMLELFPGQQVIGSIYLQVDDRIIITVDDIEDGSEFGKYNVTLSSNTDGIYIQVGNSLPQLISTGTPLILGDVGLILGDNPINQVNSDGSTVIGQVGSIFISTPVTEPPVVATSIVAEIGGTYTVRGTGPPGLNISINNTTPTPIQSDGTFQINDVSLGTGENYIVEGDDIPPNIVGSIYGVAIPPVTITQVSPIVGSPGQYNVTGTGAVGSVIEIVSSLASAEVDNNGVFEFADVALDPGSNDVSINGTVVNVIYITVTPSPTATITGIPSVNPNGSYNLSGTGTPGITVRLGTNNITALVKVDGTFTADGVTLNAGINNILNDDGGAVIGSIYMTSYPRVAITSMTSLGNSIYMIGGTGTVDGYYNINGTPFQVMGGMIPAVGVSINPGVNIIYAGQSSTSVVAGTLSFIIAPYVATTSIVVNVDGTVNLQLTGTDGTYSINSITFNISIGSGNVSGVPLVSGLNQFMQGSTVVGSYYIQSGQLVNVNNIQRNLSTPGYTVTGTGQPNLEIEIGENGTPVTIQSDGTFVISDADLTGGSNPIIRVSDDAVIGSVYLQLAMTPPVVVTGITITESNTISLSGIGTDGTYSVNGDEFIITGGQFSGVVTELVIGVNDIINTVNSQVGGSFYVYPSSLVEIDNIVDNLNGTYTITGVGQPQLDITIGLPPTAVSTTIELDGTFTISNVVLVQGNNPITETTTGDVIGTAYLQIQAPVIASLITPTGDSYTIEGTGPPGLAITVAGNNTVIDNIDGTFTFTGVVLSPGPNNITITDTSPALRLNTRRGLKMRSIPPGTVVGSIYLNVVEPDYQLIDGIVINNYNTANPAQTIISGTGGPPNGTVAVNTNSGGISPIDNDGNWTVIFDPSSLLTTIPQLTFTDEDNDVSPPLAVYQVVPPAPIAAPIAIYNQLASNDPVTLVITTASGYTAQLSIDGGSSWSDYTGTAIPNGNYANGTLRVRQVRAGFPDSLSSGLAAIMIPYRPNALNGYIAGNTTVITGIGVPGHRVTSVTYGIDSLIATDGNFSITLPAVIAVGTSTTLTMFNTLNIANATLRGTNNVLPVSQLSLAPIVGTYAISGGNVVINPPGGLASSDWQYTLNGGSSWMNPPSGNQGSVATGLYSAGSIQVRRKNDGQQRVSAPTPMAAIISPHAPVNVRADRPPNKVGAYISGITQPGSTVTITTSAGPIGGMSISEVANAIGYFSAYLNVVAPSSGITLTMSGSLPGGSLLTMGNLSLNQFIISPTGAADEYYILGRVAAPGTLYITDLIGSITTANITPSSLNFGMKFIRSGITAGNASTSGTILRIQTSPLFGVGILGYVTVTPLLP